MNSKKVKVKTSKKKMNSVALAADDRFSKIAADPKFREMPKWERKVTVDERFQGMMDKNSQFGLAYKVDKRGRPVRKTASEDLRKFYRLEEEEETSSGGIRESSGEDDEDLTEELVKKEEASSDEDESDSDNDRTIRIDLARGEGNIESSSDDDSSDESNEPEQSSADHRWAELDHEAPKVEESTWRLAVCNMNWDRIRAQDLLVLFNSFKPPAGNVLSVRIYPSEFGQERLAEEEREGPKVLKVEKQVKNEPELDESSDESTSDEEPTGERSKLKKVQLEKLRAYQLERLRYYYAVVECDSAETANAVYDACNGIEYETSATRIDLRFIPDDMTFNHAPPSDEAIEVGDLSSYEPSRFDTNALKMATAVTLTWDETDPERLKLAEKAFHTETLDKLDLKKIVASDSDDSSSGEEGTKEKYKSLLNDALAGEAKSVFRGKSLAAEEEEEGMEVKWDPSLEKEEEEESTETKKEITPFQKYLEKRKAKKKERKEEIKKRRDEAKRMREEDVAESDSFQEQGLVQNPENPDLDLLLSEETIEESRGKKRHFKLKKLIQKQKEKDKGKKKKGTKVAPTDGSRNEDDFQLDLEDKRFCALYSNHMFNIDPSDSNFKKTEGMELIRKEKLNKTKKNERLEEKGPVEQAEAPSADPVPNLITKNNQDHMVIAKSLKLKANKWSRKRKLDKF